MKKLLYLIISLVVFSACGDKIDKSKPAGPQEYPIHKNKFRATRVEGRNEAWGDFRLLFEYSGDQIETVWRTNIPGDTVGRIRVSRNDESRIDNYYVDDWIPAISQDSIDRMDQYYKDQVGEGNYSLKDSIPLSGRTRMQCRHMYYTDTRVYQQEFTYFEPREDVGITGVNFDNSYIQKCKYKYLYEYNDEGRIIVSRWGEYTYTDPKDTKVFDTRQGKEEIVYDGSSPVSIMSFSLPEGSNFVPETEYVMSYSGSRLAKITAEGYEKSFAWGTDELTVTENGRVWKYRLDNNGYPTRIEDPDGQYMEIEYEKGHGDFEVLTPLFDRLMGSPFIK